MVGFPTETAEDFGRTLEFVRRNAPNLSQVLVNGNTYILSRTRLRDEAFSVYGVEEESFHPIFWRTKDGKNDYPERVRRLEALIRCVKGEGLKLLTADYAGIDVYESWRAGRIPAKSPIKRPREFSTGHCGG